MPKAQKSNLLQNALSASVMTCILVSFKVLQFNILTSIYSSIQSNKLIFFSESNSFLHYTLFMMILFYGYIMVKKYEKRI